jgi:hypothetical protein
VAASRGISTPMMNAGVWPFPVSKEEPQAANHAITNQAGEFRMEEVTEGHHAVRAVRIDENGVYTGVAESDHLERCYRPGL